MGFSYTPCYFGVVFSAISFVISSFVLPSVLIPRFLAAVINGSVAGVELVEAVLTAEEASFAALSNSFLANPMDLASSGSFCGPQRKTTNKMPRTISHSYPTRAKAFHMNEDASRLI